MKKTVLIYDDDKEILLLCQAVLSKFGYDVKTLAKCENIIADILAIQPHLILMDLWIPDIGGEKAIGIMKSNEKVRHIPVLLFSANADIKIISEKTNAEGYVEKPFTINVLLEKIKAHISE